MWVGGGPECVCVSGMFPMFNNLSIWHWLTIPLIAASVSVRRQTQINTTVATVWDFHNHLRKYHDYTIIITIIVIISYNDPLRNENFFFWLNKCLL